MPELRKLLDNLKARLEYRKDKKRLEKQYRVQVPQFNAKTYPILDSEALFSRISKIWDLELNDIYPNYEIIFNQNIGPGVYVSSTNTIVINICRPEYIFDVANLVRHERIHSADQILSNSLPAVISKFKTFSSLFFGSYPKEYQQLMKTEAIAELSEEHRLKNTYLEKENLLSSKFFRMTILSYLTIIPTPFVMKLFARKIEFKFLRPALHKLFDKHGQDGIILYFVAPPKVIGALETILWERSMRKKGYLSQTGGLTELGIEYLRNILPKEEILKRVIEMHDKYKQLKLQK